MADYKVTLVERMGMVGNPPKPRLVPKKPPEKLEQEKEEEKTDGQK